MTVEQIRLQNLLLLIEEKGSAAALARAADTSAAYISQIVTRSPSRTKKPRGVGPDLARRLEVACSRPEGWMDVPHVQSGAVDALDHPNGLGAVTESSRPRLDLVSEDAHEDQVCLRRLDEPGGAMTSGAVTMIQARLGGLLQLLGSTPVTHIDALRLVTAVGDTMERTFRAGDILLVDTGVTHAAQDGIYVLRSVDDLLFRRLQRRADGSWLLISDSDRYTPEIVPRERKADFSIVGRVVYCWSGRTL